MDFHEVASHVILNDMMAENRAQGRSAHLFQAARSFAAAHFGDRVYYVMANAQSVGWLQERERDMPKNLSVVTLGQLEQAGNEGFYFYDHFAIAYMMQLATTAIENQIKENGKLTALLEEKTK